MVLVNINARGTIITVELDTIGAIGLFNDIYKTSRFIVGSIPTIFTSRRPEEVNKVIDMVIDPLFDTPKDWKMDTLVDFYKVDPCKMKAYGTFIEHMYRHLDPVPMLAASLLDLDTLKSIDIHPSYYQTDGTAVVIKIGEVKLRVERNVIRKKEQHLFPVGSITLNEEQTKQLLSMFGNDETGLYLMALDILYYERGLKMLMDYLLVMGK